MRGIIQFCVSAVCIGLVGAGLYMSWHSAEQGVLLTAPGKPGRLVATNSAATAFFDLNGDQMELTMLFSDEDDPQSVFRTRVTLVNGQSHSIVVPDGDDGTNNQRFTFRRNGDSVRMSLESGLDATMYVSGN